MTDPIRSAFAAAVAREAKAHAARMDAETAAQVAVAALRAAVAALRAALADLLPGYDVLPGDRCAVVTLRGGHRDVAVCLGADGYSAFCGSTRVAGPCAKVDEIARKVRAYLDFQPPEIVSGGRR